MDTKEQMTEQTSSIHFPSNRHKTPLPQLAKKCNRTLKTMEKWAKMAGLTKPREQYEKDAQERRRIVFELRQQGKKFREIGELLGISTNNAQQLARRYEGKP